MKGIGGGGSGRGEKKEKETVGGRGAQRKRDQKEATPKARIKRERHPQQLKSAAGRGGPRGVL